MSIELLGIDLAKHVFQLHGVDKNGKTVLKKRISRNKLMDYIANLPVCTIAMEACGSANYWARQFQKHQHTTRLIHPPFVKAFVKSNKNDANDAEAIAEAASRPNMRFVPMKSIAQQDLQNIHRIRSRLIKQRTALGNQIRGMLREYGIIIPAGRQHVLNHLPSIITSDNDELTSLLRETLQHLYDELKRVKQEEDYYSETIRKIAHEDEQCQRLIKVPGLGPVTVTALLSCVGDVNTFKNGRQFAAYLGLVPRQNSSGDKIKLGGISKRGDRYIRTILIQGAKAALLWSTTRVKRNEFGIWACKLSSKKHCNKVAVAIANKNARIAWRLLKDQSIFDPSACYG